jgi:hypothetical protein
MRNYWRDPGYWQWWWRNRVSGTTKGAILISLAALLAFVGFASAGQLSEEPSARVLTTERLLTVVRKVKGGVVTEVQTVTGTVSAPTETELVTVRRNGRTLVIRRPSETVTDTDTVRGRIRERVVTNTRTDTVVQTNAVDRPTTVTNTVDRPTTVTETGPARTDTVTETRDVPGPTQTVTETETNETTVTEEVTKTETVTETDTVTETVPPGKP